jgi:hypothetical protein
MSERTQANAQCLLQTITDLQPVALSGGKVPGLGIPKAMNDRQVIGSQSGKLNDRDEGGCPRHDLGHGSAAIIETAYAIAIC